MLRDNDDDLTDATLRTRSDEDVEEGNIWEEDLNDESGVLYMAEAEMAREAKIGRGLTLAASPPPQRAGGSEVRAPPVTPHPIH